MNWSHPIGKLGFGAFCAVGLLSAPSLGFAATGWRPSVAAELPAGTSGLGVFLGGENEPARGPSAVVAGAAGKILVIDGENERAVEIKERSISKTAALKNARHISDAAEAGDGRIVAYDSKGGHLWMLDAELNAAQVSKSPLERFKGLKRIANGRVAVQVGEEALELGLDALPSLLKALPVDTSPVSRFLSSGFSKALLKKPLEKLNLKLNLKKLPIRGLPTRVGSLEIAFDKGTPVLRAFKENARNAHQESQVASPANGRIASVTHLATDNQRRNFVRIEVITKTSPTIEIRRFIRVLDQDLRELTTFEIPIDDVIVGKKDIDVDESGNVVVMLPYQDNVRILRYAAP